MAENPVESKVTAEVERAPLAAPAPAGATAEVDLRTAADENEAQSLLERHGAEIRGYLRPQWIPGDGNCFFRAVARQLPEGEQHHRALRRESVSNAVHVENWLRYADFVAGENPRPELVRWATKMRRDKCWVDRLSCRALADYLQRPVLIWRRMHPDQTPTCFVPFNFHRCPPSRPLYVQLEEETPGSERYSALLLEHPAAPRAAEAKVATRRVKEGSSSSAKTPSFAEQRSLTGRDAVGDWGNLGLKEAEYALLLLLVAVEETPHQVLTQLQEKIPDLRNTAVTLPFIALLMREQRQDRACTPCSG